jgi:hypothetical protein
MTRKEQIKEKMLGISTSNFASAIDYGAYRAGFMDGVDWADRTMIERASQWLQDNLDDYLDVGVTFLASDFKKAMQDE